MNEQFYDEEIAPDLLDLAKRCHDRGLSFVAVVEWEPGEQGRTIYLQRSHGLGIELANVAAATNGNVDSLIMYIMRYGEKHGHSSACLKILGVEPEGKGRIIR